MYTIPACRAATVAFFGDYSALHEAHDAVQRWCRAQGLSMGRNWEVYGDWEDDPAKRRTDVYYELTP